MADSKLPPLQQSNLCLLSVAMQTWDGYPAAKQSAIQQGAIPALTELLKDPTPKVCHPQLTCSLTLANPFPPPLPPSRSVLPPRMR